MPIISSTYAQDAHAQKGGGRYIYERHTDDAGKVYDVTPYVAEPGFDVAGRVAARAQQLSDWLAEAEAQALLEDGA